MSEGWIGVDLGGTLARYDGGRGPKHIGEPIPAMVERVKRWLKDGQDVRVFTARVAPHDDRQRPYSDAWLAAMAISVWCLQHIGRQLVVTSEKDPDMLELWDDRAVQVETNTGRIIGYSTRSFD